MTDQPKDPREFLRLYEEAVQNDPVVQFVPRLIADGDAPDDMVPIIDLSKPMQAFPTPTVDAWCSICRVDTIHELKPHNTQKCTACGSITRIKDKRVPFNWNELDLRTDIDRTRGMKYTGRR